MIKRFFISNGTDYAMAINDEEIKVFCRLDDACLYRQKVFKEHKRFSIDTDKFLSDWFTSDSWELKEKDGSRTIYEIIGKYTD